MADFGLATIIDGPLNDCCGSPLYAAPELLKNEFYSFSVDMWGLGVTVYILCLGFFPVFYDRNDGIIEQILEIIELEEYFDEEEFHILSAPMQGLLKGLLARDPEERFTVSEAKQFWIKNKY